MKPKGVTTQMKVLIKSITLLLNRFHVFTIFMFNFNRETLAVKGFVFFAENKNSILQFMLRPIYTGDFCCKFCCDFAAISNGLCELLAIQITSSLHRPFGIATKSCLKSPLKSPV